jgi:hypothetical protein
MSWHGTGLKAALALAALVAPAAPAAAQAFMPMRGDGTVTVYYATNLVERHMNNSGASDDVGHIDTRNMIVDFSMGVGRKFAFSVTLPLVAARYRGPFPHAVDGRLGLTPAEQELYPDFQTLDDSHFHQTWQDFRGEVRYNLTTKGLALTPFATYVLPTHDYETLSHAAAGRHVRELQIGAYAARVITRWPGAFVQARYSHAFEETVADISRSRDNLVLEGGYFLTTKWRVFGMVSGQLTHGGLNVHVSPRVDRQGILYINHDRIQRTDFVAAGGGVAYSLSSMITLFAQASRTLMEINGHAEWGGLNVGMMYSFGPGVKLTARANKRKAGDDTDDALRTSQLAKCPCLKK